MENKEEKLVLNGEFPFDLKSENRPLLDKKAILEKWRPILEKLSIGEKKMEALAEYCEAHENDERAISTKITKEWSDKEVTVKYNKQHSRTILVGRAASGKDFLRKKFEDRGYKYGISYTTRPSRTGETDGIDYHFLTTEKFEAMIANNEFYEHVSFNGWHYGTTKKQFYEDGIFIMTPHGISCIEPEDRKKCFVIFLDIPIEIRRERLSLRSDADKVERRLEADELDFKDFKDYDIKINDSGF